MSMLAPSPSKTRNTRRARYRRGVLAEYWALTRLMLKGYRFLAKRYKTPVGEIDLVMRRGNILVFVEVKARRTKSEAAVAIHIKNQKRIMHAARYFLAANPAYTKYQVRFDVCLVTWYRLPHHIPHAFESRT